MLNNTDKAEIRRIFREVVRNELTEIVREEVARMSPDIMPVEKVAETYGWKKAYLSRKRDELGGMKAGGKLFFSRRRIDNAICMGEVKTLRAMKEMGSSARIPAQESAKP